jgi:hypothetical protein
MEKTKLDQQYQDEVVVAALWWVTTLQLREPYQELQARAKLALLSERLRQWRT